MADLNYNEVNLLVLKTNSMETRAIYTEDNTTYLYSEVTIDIDAQLNPEATAYVSGSPPTFTPGTLPPDTIVGIRHALLQQQKQLDYTTLDGTGSFITIISSPVYGSTVDCNNGPQPISCTIRDVSGARTWLINYRIRTWIHECFENETDPPPLLSNRWSQSSFINDQHLATKVTSGIAHFRTDALINARELPDTYRRYLLPPVSPGYRRTAINVVQNPAANVLNYQVIDSEQMTDIGQSDARLGGSGIVKLEGTYGVSSIATKEGIAGGTTMAQCDVRAWGSKYSSNWVMIQTCFQIILTKITIGAGAIGFIRQASVRESLVDRFVEVNIGFQQTAPGAIAIGALRIDGLRKDNIFAEAAGLNPGVPNDFGSRGTAEELLTCAALTEACNPESTTGPNPESEDRGSSSIYAGPPPSINVYTRDIIPEEPTPYSPGTQQYPYTSGHTDILYYKDEGILVAPIANSPADSSGSSQFQGSSTVPPVALFRLHPAIGYKVIEFTYERVGALPSIPDPNPSTSTNTDPESSSGINLTLINSELTVATPEYTDDGSNPVYRISGRYKYVYNTKTFGPGDELSMATLPWTIDPPGANAIQQSDYNGDILT